MAEGFLKRFLPNAQVFSAGTEPAASVHPNAILVMSERGIDISRNQAKSVNRFLSQRFDYVITVCDGAKESCPLFSGLVAHRLHLGFEDPAKVVGSDEFVLSEFRQIRDAIELAFREFAERHVP
jgi:arsenate reductase